MAGVNKAIIIGHVGQDPEIKALRSGGDRVANFSIATSESWKDKSTGERKERTEWHRVVVFNQSLVNIIENYVRKGSKLYVEGRIETRSWEQDGGKKYITEIVLRPFHGEITMLSSSGNGGGFNASAREAQYSNGRASDARFNRNPEFEDEIPF